jgi:EmrB/QacA subfamily drug resistance transporter
LSKDVPRPSPRQSVADRAGLNPKVVVAVVYVLALFMTIMDATIVNVALPQLGRQFGVPAAKIDGVVVGFLVSISVFIPASGWLGDRFGTKRILLTALVIFTAASALCGMAQSVNQLVVFRIVQGIGGGMLTPVGMAMLWRTFPPEERVRASRILIIPTAFAPATGPVLGGLLVTDLSWRWAFYVNVPIGIAGFLFGLLFLRESVQEEAGRFDLPGFLLAGAGLGSLMYAVSEGPAKGWSSASIEVTAAVGVVLLAALVRVELRARAPMLDLRLLGNALFRTSTTVTVLSMVSFFGSLFLVALFYQDGFGVSALQSGLSTFPEAIGIVVGAQIAARLYPHIGPRRLMAGGLLGVAASVSCMALVPFTADLWVMRGLMVALGLSQAHVFTPAQAAAFATISPASTGRASGFFNAGRQLGGAIGVAVLSTVISAVGVVHDVGGFPQPNAAAYHWAFLVAAAVALFAAVLTRGIDDTAAAATMTRSPRRSQRSEKYPVAAVPAGSPRSG